MHKLAYSERERFNIDYGREAEQEIAKLSKEIKKVDKLINKYSARWLAIKLLEGDADVMQKVINIQGTEGLLQSARESTSHLREVVGEEVDTLIADQRYGWIHGLVREAVKRTKPDRLTTSDKIDKVVTSRLLGIPIFLIMMWGVLKMTTDIAAPYLDWVDSVIGGPITNWIVAILGGIGLNGTWVESLFVDGVIAGVGGVLVFVPVLMSIYLALAILEDSGYMARAAFVMDRFMHALGLHGKSFLPMLIGFGCTVPAFYATRTLENEKDRILTGLLVPFMSCGARLPVYVLLASTFFPQNSNTVIYFLYLLGIVTAILLGAILKRTLFKSKERSAFVLELPPYRLPTIKGIWFHMWERTSAFVHKAWTLILVTSIIIWLLLAIPVSGGSFADTEVDSSAFAVSSKVLTPLFKPAGFGGWQQSSSLLTGFVAKEVVVGTMAQVYGVEDIEEEAESITFFEDIGKIITSFVNATIDTVKSIPLIIGINLFEEEDEIEPTELMIAVRDNFELTSNGHGALASIAFMVFVLIYTPCMVAIAAENQEFGIKWTMFSIFGQLLLAWLMSVIIFQGGKLIGLG